ncbi:MAG: hypothetical protein ABSG92_03405 [Conexivisphaerales archaeon]|jgi:hypothetical protein
MPKVPALEAPSEDGQEGVPLLGRDLRDANLPSQMGNTFLALE